MKLLRIHHAQISIPKGGEDAARAFYCGVLGLGEIPKPDALAGRGGFWLELAGQQIHFGAENGVERSATKAHVAYLVDSLGQWRGVLADAGVAIKEGIPIPGYSRFEFRDPFGNRVEFLEGEKTVGSEAPALETERLRLRGHRPDDLPDCFAMWSHPDVTRFIGGKPSTRQQTWMRILNYLGHWRAQGFGYWVVEEKSSGMFVGELGFADFKREMSPSIEGVPELGWALTPAMHRKGYATEALRAVTAWGDTHLGSARTVCIIDPDNAVSVRVASKIGYTKIADAVHAGVPTMLFERR